MQLLHEAREGNCVEGCNGLWLQLGKEVLENNGIILKSFQQAVINLLTKGRGKYRNIMIIGQPIAVKPLFSTLSRKYLQHFQILHQVRLPGLMLRRRNVCF